MARIGNYWTNNLAKKSHIIQSECVWCPLSSTAYYSILPEWISKGHNLHIFEFCKNQVQLYTFHKSKLFATAF